MTPQQYQRLTELFHAALEIAPDERVAFLDQVSEGNADLRRELESLLASHATALTQKPPNDVAAAYLAHKASAAGVSLLPPRSRLDRYEICSFLGKGGMGEVYLAEDIRLHRKVALKILPAEVAVNQDRVRRFEQEAQAAAALNHPNIAHIYEIGEAAGVSFIAMEFVEGITLRSKIHNERPDLRKLLNYLQQVAEGLSKAHSSGIVHRDLKPDNIMITRDDYAKILDFGLAKLIESSKPRELGSERSEVSTAIIGQQSLTGQVMGTVGYMSPEQAQGKMSEVDHRSDIFSFGCMLFESVTGHKPFARESITESLHSIVYQPAPSIKDLNPSVPPDLDRVIRRCLAKDREARYQSIKDVALDLKEVRQEIAEPAAIDTTFRSPRSTEIKSHKKVAAIIFVAAAVLFGYGLYKLASQKKSRTSSAAFKLTKLTSTGKVFAGSISPDGKHVIYSVEDAGQQSLWLRHVATSGNVQIVPPTDASYANFSFTPDGDYIYFNKAEKNGRTSLYRMSTLGGTARRIMDDVTSRAALSSDGKQVAFISGDPFARENSLVVANSDGSGEKVIASRNGPDNFAGGIAWTPDGKSITCVVGNHAQKLIDVPVDGGSERSVKTPDWFAIIRIEWLPDSSGLIATVLDQIRSSPLQIWHLSYPGGEARKLTSDFSNYIDLSLSADGSILGAIRREKTSHIWLARHGDVSRAKQLTTGNDRQDGNPAVNWTPDGNIVFDSTASGGRHTWIMNSDGSDPRQLTDGDYDDQGAHVSPDGRYIVFTSNRTGTFHVYRMDMDGNNVKQLTNGAGELAPFFSPDGRWVICSSSSHGSWKVAADGGDLIPLTKDSWASDISPDSKLVAFVKSAEAGTFRWQITIMPFDGGSPLKTFDVTSETRPNSRWTPDGRAIIYNLTRGGVLSGVTNLWSQSLDGGPPRQLTNFTSETFFSFDWSYDGKSLVYGRTTTISDIVLASNFR